jgi:hypothetical protein
MLAQRTKATEEISRCKALVQRCQWHKRENVIRYLPKAQQASALLLIEPPLRRIKGYRYLPQVQWALRTEIPRESVADTGIA